MSIRPADWTRLVAVCILVSGCERPVAEYSEGEDCEAGAFAIVDEFDGARRGKCEVFADGSATIHIHPEDEGEINNSPWYAFKLVPNGVANATIKLRYHGGDHRYWPKVSIDRVHWTRLDESAIDVGFFRSSATFAFDLGGGPLWVAAQEIVLPGDVAAWADVQSRHPEVVRSQLGRSGSGLSIDKLDINLQSRDVVSLTGRQHPPEVSGSFAFQAFYDAIVADTELANRFRERFHIVAIPMLNPDGVVAGHWRHNLGGIDLNRDWGRFSQPETRLIGDLLDSYDQQGKTIRISVDFHSTKRNLMYTQMPEDETDPPGFADRWIAASLARASDIEFDQEPRPLSENGTARNYMYQRYGVPSVTLEIGDEEDRGEARRIAAVFAEEMMRLLTVDVRSEAMHRSRL